MACIHSVMAAIKWNHRAGCSLRQCIGNNENSEQTTLDTCSWTCMSNPLMSIGYANPYQSNESISLTLGLVGIVFIFPQIVIHVEHHVGKQ